MSPSPLRRLLGRGTRTDGPARAGALRGAAVHSTAAKGLATLAVTAVAGLAVTGTGVYALMRAQAFNATAEAVSSGTLLLTLAGTGTSGGLSTLVPAMVPGDTVNRFVEVRNTGTVGGTGLTLQLGDQPTPTALTTDAVNGLQVTVTACSQAWTLTGGVGSCGGTQSTALPLTSAVAAKAAAQPLGATLASGTSAYYRVGLTLPTNAEVSLNGTLPVGSVQGLAASLRWTFSLDQRAATTTDT